MIKLVLGGARSGKSEFAEDIYKGIDDVTYIAMLTNILFDHLGARDIDDEDVSLVEKLVIDEVATIFTRVKEMDADIVIVSSELGAGLVPEAKLSRLFRDMHGKVNQYIAKNADEVYYVIASIGVKIK